MENRNDGFPGFDKLIAEAKFIKNNKATANFFEGFRLGYMANGKEKEFDPEEYKHAYLRGREDGRAIGYEEGYEDAVLEKNEDTAANTEIENAEDAFDDGFDEGYDTGYADGYMKAKNELKKETENYGKNA